MDADARNFALSWFVEDRMQLLAFKAQRTCQSACKIMHMICDSCETLSPSEVSTYVLAHTIRIIIFYFIFYKLRSILRTDFNDSSVR